MKFTVLALAAAATLSLAFIAPKPTPMNPTETAAATGTIYDFTVKTIDGKDVKLSKYKGKKLLIVNTASKCGYTPQYKDDATPLYKFLADKDKNGAVSEAPSWNFCKYLVDEKGHVVKFYPSKVKPLSEELVADITK